MLTREALDGLSRHDLLIQLVLAREENLVKGGVLDADAVADLIEEVLVLVVKEVIDADD